MSVRFYFTEAFKDLSRRESVVYGFSKNLVENKWECHFTQAAPLLKQIINYQAYLLILPDDSAVIFAAPLLT